MGHISIFSSPKVIEIQKQMEVDKVSEEFIAVVEYHKNRINMLRDNFLDTANICQKYLSDLREIVKGDIR